ncbi:methyl-accepting chemotaxis protein [Tropicibacter sp. R15_0]|uniref:methyl-accepting chemotaxis protein n=1 Tax=Tropicibacter sp. R15_0 TaxID=2821101 RepID=UPI001ADAD3D1|nr:HAMP domain-containing methyl-accepting chemotaxis protein [Tropicibacter sp. R15_0]MBO9466940.1 methyl-accepting chemotaxis protein [Tropicibacter sp. R15_0]
MSRFSIRAQIFALAGAFLVLMLGGALFALINNTRVATLVKETSHAAEVDFQVSEALSAAEGALLSVLMIDRAEPGAYETLSATLSASVSSMDKALAGLPEVDFSSDVQEQVTQDLTISRSELDALFKEIPAFQAEQGFKRSRDFRNRVIPLLQAKVALLAENHRVLRQNSEAKTTDMLSVVSATTTAVIAGIVVSTILGIALALVFGKMLATPIRRVTHSVGLIAEKDYAEEIPDTNRRDEIGEIMRQLDVLRTKLSKGEKAAANVKIEHERRAELFVELGHAMSKLKAGDLSDRIECDDWQDLGESYVDLCQDFNDLANTLAELVKSLRDSARTVEGNSCELSNMSNEMSRRAEVQAATLEESAAALDELSESVQGAATRAQEADEQVVEGRRRAEEGGQVMHQALEAMSSIAKSSDQITQIIGVIDDIAFQTNLLALNAGVEAARAGESGKGFAVVASEVRGLAQRAAESASEIKDLVLNSTAQVEDGEKLVQQTSETLGLIVESVTNVSETVSGIAISAREQASAVKEINVGVAELDKVTQQNAAMVGDATTSSQELSGEASRLTELLERFAGASEPMEVHEPVELDLDHDSLANFGGEAASQSNSEPQQVSSSGSLGQGLKQAGSTSGVDLDLTQDLDGDNMDSNWENQPTHSAPVDADVETWSADLPEPEPVPMDPHQPVAANADQWKEF